MEKLKVGSSLPTFKAFDQFEHEINSENLKNQCLFALFHKKKKKMYKK